MLRGGGKDAGSCVRCQVKNLGKADVERVASCVGAIMNRAIEVEDEDFGRLINIISNRSSKCIELSHLLWRSWLALSKIC